MILRAGYMLTEAHKRDAPVKAFAGMVERARKYDGCLDLSISADPIQTASTSSSAGATSGP
jgi:quinol monooxygenase YgiN